MFEGYDYTKFTSDEVLEYLRKSRSDDPLKTVEEVLEHHELMLNEYADKSLGGRVPAKNIYREVVSGETIDDRPQMLELLRRIESPEVKAVMVVEVQRLSRGDLEDAGRLIKLLRYTNTQVIALRPVLKTFDLNNKYDREAFERELKQGNEYLEYSKTIMYSGKLIAVKEGNYIATYAPYGYKKVHYKEGKSKCSTLEIIPEQAKVIERIFDLYVNTDLGFIKIADKINELHIPPANGDIWKAGTIKEIISNITYTGKVRWQYRKTTKTIEDQKLVKSRPRNKIKDYLVFEGKHEAIISDELFNAAQKKRGKNIPIKTHNHLTNPLAGIFYCAKCGKAMRLRQGNSKQEPRFECSEMRYCNNGSATYSEIIERVYEVLDECIADFEVKLENETNLDDVTRHADLIATLERRLKDLEAKELKQWEKYSEEGMPKTVFEKLNEKVKQDKQEVQEALCMARESMPEPVNYEERVLSFKAALNALKDINISINNKNRFLRQIIARMTYKREKPIRLTKDLANQMGVPYPHRLCWHRYPFELDITLSDDV